MKYDLILFDADDTLFDFAQCEDDALAAAFAEYGLSLDETIRQQYREINRKLWKDYERKAIEQQVLKVERFSRLFAALGATIDAHAFSQSYLEHLSCQHAVVDHAVEVLAELHGHAKLVIVTNGISKVQRGRIGLSAINRYIDHIVISEEVGCPKPAREIFDYAFSAAQHSDKERAIIVGDNLLSDIAGGAAYGIDTCWFNPRGEANRSSVQPTYEIRKLGGLLGIVR